jgi:uncharacterized protein (DUF1778 family)
MSSETHISNIEKYLIELTRLIELDNSVNRSSRTIDAENLFCILLNTAFGWQLVNANERKANQDSFDLVDEIRKLHVQITSNKAHARKLKKTVDGFKKQKHKKGTRLIVLFIAQKCSPQILEKKTVDNFQYEGYDIEKLFKELYYKNKSPLQLQHLNEVLEAEMSPVLLRSGAECKARSVQPLPAPVIKLRPSGVYINRKALVEEIFSFGQITHGLLVGGPGVGKSFVIDELQRLCKAKKIPCLIVRINDLLDATAEEIKDNLELDDNDWIGVLKNAQASDWHGKGLLLFDAFDTAKDEKIKARIVSHIKRALLELSSWSVLVSARTFDAAKSVRLQELFPSVNIHRAISCRAMEIPVLTDQELTASVKSDPAVRKLFEKSTASLRQLLKVPYFLKLFERIVKESGAAERKHLTTIETEEQLLNIYWIKNIAARTELDVFLQKLTALLAVDLNLTCRREKVVTEANSDAYDELISLGVLEESSATRQNVTFTHNILLDYAISRYLLPEEPTALIAYLRHNYRMPFLFRQSFIYFYSRLWNVDDNLFWKHYFATRAINEPLFRLFHQTVLNFLLGSNYIGIEQLSPVFSFPDANERTAVIRKILEGIRFVNKGSVREKDYKLLHKISTLMGDFLLWELGFMLNKAIAKLDEQPSPKLLRLAAITSHNYMEFVLKRRRSSPNKWAVDNNGAMWGVENVCKTFSVNKTNGRRLIAQVLKILKEEDFPIRFFYTLSDNLLSIFKQDTAFGAFVYQALYLHNETSNKETYLGNSAVLSLRSNRQQDFSTIYHKLEGDIPEILQLFPDEGVQLAIGIANRFGMNKSDTYISSTFRLKVNGDAARLTSNYFFYNSEDDKKYGPMSHLENVFKYFEKLSEERKYKDVDRLLNYVFAEGEASIIWRTTLKFLTAYPSVYKRTILSLLQNEGIYVCNETVYEAGELVKALWPHLTQTEKRNLEASFVVFSKTKLLKGETELRISRMRRLLGCIPAVDLKSPVLKEFLSDHGGSRRNEPLVSYSGLQSYKRSNEERISDVGVDVSVPLEMHVYNLIKKVELFNIKYDHNSNDKPAKAEYEPLMATVSDLWRIVKSKPAFKEKLLFNCDYEVSRFAKLLSRNGSKLNKATRSFVEAIAYHYLDEDVYKVPVYENGDIKHRWGAYSPNPRTAATSTFVLLLQTDRTGNMAPVVLTLMEDNKQIVRLKALRALQIFWHKYRDDFWQIVQKRVRVERDGMCLHDLISSVCYNNIMDINQAEVERVAELALQNLAGKENEDGDDPVVELWRSYSVLLLKLLVYYDSPTAKKLVYEALSQKRFARSFLIEAVSWIDPHREGANYITEPNQHDFILHIIRDALQIRFQSIQSKGLKSDNVKDDFEVIDFCIQQLYFALVHGRNESKGRTIDRQNKEQFYFKLKPILRLIVDSSTKIENGFMVAHTGYYFMQLLNHMLYADADFILSISADIVRCAAINNFTYDQITMKEVVKMAEQILADHKDILAQPEQFSNMIAILDQFAKSGWQEALELTWRLKEVF